MWKNLTFQGEPLEKVSERVRKIEIVKAVYFHVGEIQ